MNKLLHLEPIGGVAGDMFVSAIVNAFPQLQHKLLLDINDFLPDYVKCSINSNSNGGIVGSRFNVDIKDREELHNQPHLTFVEICNMIKSDFDNKSVVKIAINIFHHLAKAESKIHGVAVEDVHFHEISDWDSIADIVSSAWLIHNLSDDVQWSYSPLPLGHGTIKTMHGYLPVPAPATALLLKGFNVFNDQIEGERVTPTGAAIMKEIKPLDKLPMKHLKIDQIGYGLGSKTLDGVPNILRLIKYDIENNYIQRDQVLYLSFNIDDQTPEELAISLDMIRGLNGVIDVTQSIAYGKKNRLVFKIDIMATLESRNMVLDSIFSQTTTLGIREKTLNREILSRKSQELNINGKKIHTKTVTRPNDKISTKVESNSLYGETLVQRREIQDSVQRTITKKRDRES